MRAGRLREAATLQNPAATGDDFSTATGYADVPGVVRCEIRDLSGKEFRGAQQDGSEVSAEIICRYRADITSASRLVVGVVVYQVVAVLRVGARRQDMRLQCKAVT